MDMAWRSTDQKVGGSSPLGVLMTVSSSGLHLGQHSGRCLIVATYPFECFSDASRFLV
jgi:hypothetical protein